MNARKTIFFIRVSSFWWKTQRFFTKMTDFHWILVKPVLFFHALHFHLLQKPMFPSQLPFTTPLQHPSTTPFNNLPPQPPSFLPPPLSFPIWLGGRAWARATCSSTVKKGYSYLCMCMTSNWLERNKTLIRCGKYSTKKFIWENQHLSWIMYTWAALNDNAK